MKPNRKITIELWDTELAALQNLINSGGNLAQRNAHLHETWLHYEGQVGFSGCAADAEGEKKALADAIQTIQCAG